MANCSVRLKINKMEFLDKSPNSWVVDTLSTPALWTAFGVTGNPEDAEDVLPTIFVRLQTQKSNRNEA
jgi:hypothetical protein